MWYKKVDIYTKMSYYISIVSNNTNVTKGATKTMKTLNVNEGDFLVTDNGLGSMTYVYLAKDENCTDGDGAPPMPGYFSAWFYNPKYGIDCADWGMFSLQDYPFSSKCDHTTVDRLSRDPEIRKHIGTYLNRHSMKEA